jgi:hypothetical protein
MTPMRLPAWQLASPTPFMWPIHCTPAVALTAHDAAGFQACLASDDQWSMTFEWAGTGGWSGLIVPGCAWLQHSIDVIDMMWRRSLCELETEKDGWLPYINFQFRFGSSTHGITQIGWCGSYWIFYIFGVDLVFVCGRLKAVVRCKILRVWWPCKG